MFHYTYITVNKNTGQYYGGVRSSKCDPYIDKYFGSGVRLKRHVEKHGVDAMHRYVVSVFDSREDALNHERELVNDRWLSNPACLNIARGGGGKPIGRKEHQKPHAMTDARRAAIEKWVAAGRAGSTGVTRSAQTKAKISEANTGRTFTWSKPRSAEDRKNKSESQRGKTISEAQKAKLRIANKAAWARRKANGTDKQATSLTKEQS